MYDVCQWKHVWVYVNANASTGDCAFVNGMKIWSYITWVFVSKLIQKHNIFTKAKWKNQKQEQNRCSDSKHWTTHWWPILLHIPNDPRTQLNSLPSLLPLWFATLSQLLPSVNIQNLYIWFSCAFRMCACPKLTSTHTHTPAYAHFTVN